MDNLAFYEQAREVPQEAKKDIKAGRLKGMTDINPMYRIKRLTEMFGPCGIGWWYEIVDKHLAADELTKQVAAFVDILLFYVDPESGATSRGIPGTGGSTFVAQERNGPYMSDECYKMALTDAISVAAKSLGIGADVYWEKDRTKYSAGEEEPTGSDPKNKSGNGGYIPQCARCGNELSIQEHDDSVKIYKRPLCRECQDKAPKCEDCRNIIVPYISPKNGGTVKPEKHADGTMERFGKVLCPACVEREQKIRRVEEYAAKMAAGEGE